MRIRVALARFLISLGRFVQSSALMVMRPDDLIEFSRQTYAKARSVDAWNQPEILEMGLSPAETALLEKLPAVKGKLLLLGVGSGREAIAFGKRGYEVTGVDFIPRMLTNAEKNAARCGLEFNGLLQNISALNVPADSFDLIWLSVSLYSAIPTRTRRIEMLRRIAKALVSSGYLVCQFHWDELRPNSHLAERFRKLIAFLTAGHLDYEPGDQLWGNVEFMHAFSDLDKLKTEFESAGFELVDFHISKENLSGGAVLKPSRFPDNRFETVRFDSN